ncbi:MAG: zinc ABC transporter substrate-binding protein [Desulfurococcales archaeon]|nr:zinc ABC transporter substrate-binding protein [Desulfurococcales archaeon]
MSTMSRMASIIILALIITSVGYYILQNNSKKVTQSNEILIVSTFPSLVDDIKLVTCANETVETIVPKGVDPHDYQLTPRDAGLLKKATVIVSTGHAPFEIKIRNLVESNETRAILIEIPKMPGIKILNNPVTGEPNYHMPIMDPYNYILFMEKLVTVLNQVDPKCASIHVQNLHKVNAEIEQLLKFKGEYNMTVIASDPTVQYEVSWLGLKVKYLFVIEHGTPASFDELNKINKALTSKEVHCIIASTSTSRQLQDLINSISAGSFNVRIAYIPGPLADGSIPEKLNETITDLQVCQK